MRESSLLSKKIATTCVSSLFLFLSFITLSQAENLWSYQPQAAGRVLVGGGWFTKLSLGTLHASPEFEIPLQLVYHNQRTQKSLWAMQWHCPQLESSILPQAEGVLRWNAASEVTSRTWNGETLSYRYDPSGQLLDVLCGKDIREQYRYDPAGNMILKRLGSQISAMTYNAANQIERRYDFPPSIKDLPTDPALWKKLSSHTTLYHYDAAGRLTAEGDTPPRRHAATAGKTKSPLSPSLPTTTSPTATGQTGSSPASRSHPPPTPPQPPLHNPPPLLRPPPTPPSSATPRKNSNNKDNTPPRQPLPPR